MELRQVFQAWLALQLRPDKREFSYPVHTMSLAEQVSSLWPASLRARQGSVLPAADTLAAAERERERERAACLCNLAAC